jgi:ligand-binding sensor domain-containing protein/putative methionine-R-sulfoxide reductase with GAF domain
MLFAGFFKCYAQHPDYVFRYLTKADGLIAQNAVTALCQDKEGFIWIGTQTGVQRYDGKRFKNYVADIRDTAALQSDWISAIYEDSKNRLWFCSDPEGPYILNRATGKFYNYNLHAAQAGKINGIWTIQEDRQGFIWIAGHDGLYRLNDTTNQFEPWNTKLGIDKKTKTGWLTIDADNNFWISTTTGIRLYNQKENKLYSNTYNPYHNHLFDIKEGVGISLKTDTDLWVTAERKIYKYNFSKNVLEIFTFEKPAEKLPGSLLQKENPVSLYSLQDGKIIVPLAGRGLAIYNPRTNTFGIVESDNTKSDAYHAITNSDANICLLQDKAGNIFIGSDNGIHIYNPEKQLFQTHKRAASNGALFPAAIVSGFVQLEDGNVYISYYDVNGGIAKADSNLQFKKQYLYNDNGTLSNGTNKAWNIFKDEQGMIWAPNQDHSVLKLNTKTEKITNQKDSVLSGPIIIIKQDRGGVIWMGHWSKGLVKMNVATGTKKFYNGFLTADSNNLKRVESILVEEDKLWIGTTQNGLQVFDKKTEKFTAAFVVNERSKTSISNNCVKDILAYNKDTLVLATLTGIDIFDKKSKTFTAITTNEGLPNNLVQTVTKDDFGNVWIAFYTNELCKMNMHTLSITKYNWKDGLTGKDFDSKFYKLKNGSILLGGTEGFISFDPAKFHSAGPPANVRITNFHVFEKETAIDSLIKNNQPLTLSYKENSIKVEFASFEYWSPESIKYFYKLEGVDKDWVPADASNTAVYNQLKEGNYVFTVTCSNREGIFCNQVTKLKITITPPFWKTWWFALLLFTCFILLIYLFIKWRVKNIRTIEAEKLKVQQLNAEQYKSKLELEQIINYFSSSLIDKHTVDDVLWDVAKNLIGRLGFVDCMIYLWNDDKTKMLQKAGHGPKDSEEEIQEQLFEVYPGQGLVGYVMQTKEAVVVADTTKDSRYRPDDIVRLSEITVPIIYNDELIGVLDSEHPERNFYTPQHLQLLTTIATLVANKIKSIDAEQLIQQKNIEVYSMNEQLSKAKLEALRSQMNPHFIFNSLNAIQECILTNNVDAAYKYLSKFSKLQRMVLNNSQKELIPLSDEIEMLQLYLSLESLRFSKSFVYTIDITGIADANEIMIPSLITQPLVENAIWHGLRNKEGDKTLVIIYEEREGSIFITIDDNGIGRGAAAAIKKQKIGSEQFASRGTLILQQRLQVLSQQFNADIQLETTDKKDGQGNAAGTKVILSFPSNLEID